MILTPYGNGYLVYLAADQLPLGFVWKGCGGWAGRLNSAAESISVTGRTRKEAIEALIARDAGCGA